MELRDSPPFAEGDRIKLVSMGPDPCPIEPGATGTVLLEPVLLRNSWNVCVRWDNGRALGLVVPPDVAEKI